MARYTSQSHLQRLFGREKIERLTSGGPGVVDSDELEAALKAADGEVDSYLQGVADLPLDEVPGSLKLQASKIALWYLAGDNVPEGTQKKYESAINALERIQDGTGGLGLEKDGDQARRDGGGVQTESPDDRSFDRDSLSGYGR
jgi:phage gp36-like protein